jgi:hypothetical protein
MNHLNDLPRKHYSHQKVTCHPTPCKKRKIIEKNDNKKTSLGVLKGRKKYISKDSLMLT